MERILSYHDDRVLEFMLMRPKNSMNTVKSISPNFASNLPSFPTWTIMDVRLIQGHDLPQHDGDSPITESYHPCKIHSHRYLFTNNLLPLPRHPLLPNASPHDSTLGASLCRAPHPAHIRS